MTPTDRFPAARYAAPLSEGDRNHFAMFTHVAPYDRVIQFLRRQGPAHG